jgi:hypothetical protein
MSDEAARFVDRLIELALLRQQTDDANLAVAINEVWSGESPRIEVFDDLAELISADPIHDVDEQVGWPTPRPAQ